MRQVPSVTCIKLHYMYCYASYAITTDRDGLLQSHEVDSHFRSLYESHTHGLQRMHQYININAHNIAQIILNTTSPFWSLLGPTWVISYWWSSSSATLMRWSLCSLHTSISSTLTSWVGCSGNGTTFRQFLRYVPSLVSTLYDQWLTSSRTVASEFLSGTHTVSPGTNSVRSQAPWRMLNVLSCLCFCCLSLSWTSVLSGTLRVSCSRVVGTVVLNLRPISISDGLYPICKGVAL